MVELFFANFTRSEVSEKFVRENIEGIFNVLGKKEKYQLGVCIVGKDKIKKLNKVYRNKDKVTDILSFRENDVKYKYSKFFHDQSGLEDLGEIFICWQKVKKQAKERSWAQEKELTFLLIHGILHIFGYDHEKEKDAKKMESLERKVVDLLPYNFPL